MAALEVRKSKKRKHGKTLSKQQNDEKKEDDEFRLEDVIDLGGTKVELARFSTFLILCLVETQVSRIKEYRKLCDTFFVYLSPLQAL